MRNIRPPGRLTDQQRWSKLVELTQHVEQVLKSTYGEEPSWMAGDAYDTATALMSELDVDVSFALEALWFSYRTLGIPECLTGITETDALFVFYDASKAFRSEMMDL